MITPTIGGSLDLRAHAFLSCQPPGPSSVVIPDRLTNLGGEVLGPVLTALTPWRHHVLWVLGDSFTAEMREGRNLIPALWVCSAGFRPGSGWRYRMFARKHRGSRSSLATEAAFVRWVKAQSAFVASQVGRSEQWKADERFIGDLVVLFNRAFGMSLEDTIHSPYARLACLLKACDRNNGGLN